MAELTECPSCGAPLENVTGTQCPFCGSALPARGGSARTIITSKPGFKSSAEVMDEVKKLVREGDASAAAEVAASEFGLDKDAAQDAVEQVEVDMRQSGLEPAQAAPEPASYSSPAAQAMPAAQKTGSTRWNWIIGGSIGAGLFLCVCCILPVIVWLVLMPARK